MLSRSFGGQMIETPGPPPPFAPAPEADDPDEVAVPPAATVPAPPVVAPPALLVVDVPLMLAAFDCPKLVAKLVVTPGPESDGSVVGETPVLAVEVGVAEPAVLTLPTCWAFEVAIASTTKANAANPDRTVLMRRRICGTSPA
jgi:hypothetical protein